MVEQALLCEDKLELAVLAVWGEGKVMGEKYHYTE